MFGSRLRCPKCNEYAPDRCICNDNTHLPKGGYKGRCNRSACLKPGADWWNYSTQAYYCRECALEINAANIPRHSGLYLCVPPTSMPRAADTGPELAAYKQAIDEISAAGYGAAFKELLLARVEQLIKGE